MRELEVTQPGRRLALHVHLDSLFADVDPLRLGQVLENLLSNAVKYSAEDSPIEVTLECLDEHALISVRDYGIGIPAGTRDQLFRPFARGENANASSIPGMGLGLHISRQLVEAHGGQLTLSSEGEGKGTTAQIRLPLSKATADVD